jgi:hypothetical protein
MSKVTVRVLLVGIFLIGLSGAASAQSFVYSHQFDTGFTYCPGDAQYDDWLSYRAGLPATGVLFVTISGSQDPTGITCSDPVAAQQIADAMRNMTTTTVSCDGNDWSVFAGSCQAVGCALPDNDLEITINNSGCNCSTTYTLRPGIGNENWGGIAGPTCDAATQTLTFTVGTAFANEVPTSTGLGLVLLVVMLAASGIAVLWRR